MFVIQIVLLLLLLAGLAALLLQNWFPVLGLVFLGMKSQPLPLAVWILASVAAGGLTSLLIAGLFKISNFTAVRQSMQNIKASPKNRTGASYRAAPAPDNRPQAETDATETSDWDTNDSDWDWDEDADAMRNNNPEDRVRSSTNYESQQEPQSSYRSGSVYSYGYREPKDTGVGKTEAVYEADYRVITPPYQKPNPVEAEDWGFEDEDEFESEDEKK